MHNNNRLTQVSDPKLSVPLVLSKVLLVQNKQSLEILVACN